MELIEKVWSSFAGEKGIKDSLVTDSRNVVISCCNDYIVALIS